MTTDEIAGYLRPYLAAQSIDAMRADFPRWIGFLGGRGVTNVNDPGADNLMALLVHQAAPDDHSAICHNLRDVSGVRRYKG